MGTMYVLTEYTGVLLYKDERVKESLSLGTVMRDRKVTVIREPKKERSLVTHSLTTLRCCDAVMRLLRACVLADWFPYRACVGACWLTP